MTELFKIVSSLIYHILIPFISILFFTIIYCSHTFIAIFASAFSHDQVSQPYNLSANFLPLYYILLPSFQNLTHLYFFSIRLLPKMMFPRSLIHKSQIPCSIFISCLTWSIYDSVHHLCLWLALFPWAYGKGPCYFFPWIFHGPVHHVWCFFISLPLSANTL